MIQHLEDVKLGKSTSSLRMSLVVVVLAIASYCEQEDILGKESSVRIETQTI